MFKVLEKIAFTTQNGLVFCNEPHKAEIVEILLLDDARKLGASAVLFRRYFRDNENAPYKSEPSVYIFEKKNINNQVQLHAKIWSAGRAEVYIVFGETEIKIFNARRPAEVKEGELSLDNLELVREALEQFDDQRFAAHLFGTGTFWEQGDFDDKTKGKQFYENKLAEENTPYHQLFRFLKEVRKKLVNDQTIKQENVIDKILIICILIKFLEEIKDKKGHTLSQIYNRFGVSNFAEALFQNSENGKVIDILEELGKQLNGKIFDYFTEQQKNETEQDFIKRNNEIKQELKKQDLSSIAYFLLVRLNKDTGELEFDLDSKQIKIDFEEFKWSQYSFRHLPIELISSIYEHFLQEEAKQLNEGAGEKGVVYTPPFLVNFLIDEVIPLDRYDLLENDTFKILDPSCGSGIFLVAAYKRILQWWIIQYYQKHKKIPSTFDPKIFQELLEKNIFGVDINEKATLISIFSLTIAFLDKLSPIAFWENLKFAQLRKNIPTKNFFEWAVDAPKDFDLVIGNPPFNVPTNTEKKDIVNEYVIKKLNFKHKDIPNNNFALHFFEAAMILSKKVGMIIPSNVILYSKDSQKYRNQIFTDFTIEKIYDFTHLRESLFVKKKIKGEKSDKKRGRTPVVAIIAENKPSQQNNIEHIVVKKINSTENKTRFEIDHYDRHIVAWNWAIDETKQFIWKCNLLGGGRLFHLIYRLSLVRTLGKFIEDKPNSWKYMNGYIGQYGDLAQNKQVDFLNGKPTIKAKSFDEFGNYKTITIPNEAYFWNTREKGLYAPPHIVFKLVVETNKIPMAFVEEYLCFNSSFVGISAPIQERDELYEIYERLHKDEKLSNLYRTFILATSSKAMVYHETSIVKEDIDNLPYPQERKYLIPSPSEEHIINDVLTYYIHLGKSLNKGGAELYKKADNDLLADYGKSFCELINPIHAENDMFWQIGEVYKTPDEGFIAYQFVFGKEKKQIPFEIRISNREELYEQFEILTTNVAENRGVIYERIIRWYGNTDEYDYVVFIKPNAKRYWLKSIALRDADETVWDYFKEGY